MDGSFCQFSEKSDSALSGVPSIRRAAAGTICRIAASARPLLPGCDTKHPQLVWSAATLGGLPAPAVLSFLCTADSFTQADTTGITKW
jgi:hypothetical protein